MDKNYFFKSFKIGDLEYIEKNTEAALCCKDFQVLKECARFYIFYKGDLDKAKIICDELLGMRNFLPQWIYFYSSMPRSYQINLFDKILYTPIPKNGSTSIKRYLLENFKKTDEPNKSPHAFFGNPFFSTKNHSDKNLQKIVILRDPVERFFSYYNKNIVQERSLVKESVNISRKQSFDPDEYYLPPIPDIEFFVKNWGLYCLSFNDAFHHLLPQKAYIHHLSSYDHVFRMSEIDSAARLIKSSISGGNLSLYNKERAPNEMVSNRKINIKDELQESIREIYSQDFLMLDGDILDNETFFFKIGD